MGCGSLGAAIILYASNSVKPGLNIYHQVFIKTPLTQLFYAIVFFVVAYYSYRQRNTVEISDNSKTKSRSLLRKEKRK